MSVARSALLRTILGRLGLLALLVATVAGGAWAWMTSPRYLVSQQYFITVAPDEAYRQRSGRSFDLGSSYHRSLLVSGPLAMPFGAAPDTNLLLLERGADPGSPVEKINARLYADYCGLMFDEKKSERVVWRGARLCNSGKLRGEVLQAAVAEFHDRTDAEISSYRNSVLQNAAAKLGAALTVALLLLLTVAAAMWVTKGRLV